MASFLRKVVAFWILRKGFGSYSKTWDGAAVGLLAGHCSSSAAFLGFAQHEFVHQALHENVQ